MDLRAGGAGATQSAMLPRRALGKTGLTPGVLGLGAVKLGRSAGLKYPAPFQIPDDDAAANLLAVALDLGINLIDTAPAYGDSEERLGRLIGSRRDRWIISTKTGEEFDAEAGRSAYDFSPRAVTASAERSLRRLRTDRLDILLLHSDGRDEWIIRESGAMEALARLRERGLARAIGISTKTPEGAALAVEVCDVVMVTLNEEDRGDLTAIEAASSRGVGVLVKKALRSGRAEGGGVERALALALAPEGVSSVIVGTISPEHLRANALAAMNACYRSPESGA